MLLDSPTRPQRESNAATTTAASFPSPVKLLCFVPTLGNGGAEMHLLRLLNHFDRSRFQPQLAVARDSGSYEARLAADVHIERCGWTSLPSATLRTQSAVRALRRLIQVERPSVVIAFLEQAIAVTAQALAGLSAPLPLFIAGIQNNLEQTLHHLPRWASGWLRREIIAAYTRADHIIALSHGVADSLRELIPETTDRVSVVHNAGYDREVELLSRQEHPLPLPHNPFFLGCGRLTAQKDFETLLLAFHRIKNEVEGELWILGEGPLRPRLERKVATLGLSDRVRLPGFVKNPFAVMARASTFVLSSQWEGFGNVITEAMACGTPVISTDCPHGPGEILESGRWGELVPVGNISTLADAMRKSRDQQEQFRTRARQASEHVKQFEAATITRRYEEVIHHVQAHRATIQAP